MVRLTKLTLLLLLFSALPVKSQDIIVGAKLGIGNARFKNQSTSEFLKGYAVSRAGISLAFSPYFSNLQIISGADFETSKMGDFLSVPFAARLIFGEKYRPFAEIGGYYSFVLQAKQNDYILKNSAGARVGFGMTYAIDKHMRLEAGYFQRFGLSPAVEEEIELPANQFDYDTYLMRGGNIEIAFKYRF